MQTTFHPDSTIEKITLYIDGKPIQVLITFTKEKQEIFIHQISERLLVVHAPQGISLDEIRKQVRDYKNPLMVDEHSGTKKEHSALSGGTIHIKGLDIPYTVVYNPRRKTLYLSIYPDGRVVVENPGTATEEDIIRFLHSKKSGFTKNISAPVLNALLRMRTRPYRSLIQLFPTGYVAIPGVNGLR
jgi:predicted metal-dependent hydrolase